MACPGDADEVVSHAFSHGFIRSTVSGWPPTGPLAGAGVHPAKGSVLLLVVILAAVIGSCATLALTLAHRAGYSSLEKGWGWWYVPRPFTASGIGVLAHALFRAGLFGSNKRHQLRPSGRGGKWVVSLGCSPISSCRRCAQPWGLLLPEERRRPQRDQEDQHRWVRQLGSCRTQRCCAARSALAAGAG